MKTSIIIGLVMAMATIPGAIVSAHSPNFCAAFNSPHSYGAGGSAGSDDSVTGSHGAGVVTVSDNNADDCNHDQIPGDFDGDYEAGVGGGFFGAGPWRNETVCQYGLVAHGTSVAVTDGLSANIGFVTGADDQAGPVVIPDPATGGNICETDGNISPCPTNGDPCGPTDDADDCLSADFVNSGTACGFGGDGGYWVFLHGVRCSVGNVPPGPPTLSCTETPTAGFIQAS